MKQSAFFASVLMLLIAPPLRAQPTEDRIEAIVARVMAAERIPGVSIVAIRGGKRVLSRAWGIRDFETGAPMTVSTVQPIYSVSKHITAALILKLAARNKLDIDTPVAAYLPEWFSDEPDLRVRNLLRNTSGLPEFLSIPAAATLDSRAGATLADVMALVDREPRRFAPGERHGYSNSNYTALALIAERVTGQRFAELVQAELFVPVRLASMGECSTTPPVARGYVGDQKRFDLPVNLAVTYAGTGGICASAEALAQWIGLFASGRILPRSRIAEMTAEAPVGAGYIPPYGYGLSVAEIGGRRAWWHTGAGEGWGAFAAHFPDDDLTLVVLANKGPLWVTDLAIPVARVLLGHDDPPPLQKLPIAEAKMVLLNGRFEDGLFEFRIDADNRRIRIDVPQFGEPVELFRQADDTFVSEKRPDTFRLRLERNLPIFEWMEHRSYLERSREPAP